MLTLAFYWAATCGLVVGQRGGGDPGLGQRGRAWSCWYQFGSGTLPRAVALPAAKWDQIDPTAAPPLVPSLAEIEIAPPITMLMA